MAKWKLNATNVAFYNHTTITSLIFFLGLGLADLKGMCKQDTSCTLNKDTGLGTAFTLAHETAHK